MALHEAALPALYGSSLFLMVSVALYFTTFRRSFEMRRAKIFLELRLYEGFLIGLGLIIIGLVAADAAVALVAPSTLRVFPDAVIRAILYSCISLLYFRFYSTILREGRSRGA